MISVGVVIVVVIEGKIIEVEVVDGDYLMDVVVGED